MSSTEVQHKHEDLITIESQDHPFPEDGRPGHVVPRCVRVRSVPAMARQP